MKMNGARNATAAAISRLWLATASRNRLRRTLAGGRRRTSATGAVTALIAAPPGRPNGAS